MVETDTDLQFIYKVASEFQKSIGENPAAYKAYNSLCNARAAIEDAAQSLLDNNPAVSMKIINEIKRAAIMVGEVQAYMLEVE